MLDSLLAPRLLPVSVLAKETLARLRVAPAHQTALGAVLGLAAAVFVIAGHSLIALAPLLIGWVLRRLAPPTPLDRFLDFLCWCALSFAFALADPPRALAAAFLIFSLAVLDAARSTDEGATPLLTRPIEQSELLLAFSLACIFPFLFSILSYVVGILCFLSAGFSLARSSRKCPK